FRVSINIEMVVGASLLAAVFMPWWLNAGPILGFIIYLLKVIVVISLISLLRSLFARLRLDQMIYICWRLFAPLAFLQVVINLILKGVLFK
ncbi:MAG: NADH-quinone oxidoreductase subunit H, partial [Candidatus Omnitrophota bacterium]